jgi:hypothetical protein
MDEADNTDESLAWDMIRLATEAVMLHHRMTGDADAEEAFIRDQIAIGLHREHNLTVSMEVTPGEFRKAIAEPAKTEAYDLFLKSRLKGHEIDLIIWPAEWPNPRYPRAIVEIKKGQDPTEDIDRTSQLLSVCHPNTLGYQIACVVCKEQALPATARNVDTWIARSKGICRPAVAGPPVPIPDDGNKNWCAVLVVPVIRPAEDS